MQIIQENKQREKMSRGTNKSKLKKKGDRHRRN